MCFSNPFLGVVELGVVSLYEVTTSAMFNTNPNSHIQIRVRVGKPIQRGKKKREGEKKLIYKGKMENHKQERLEKQRIQQKRQEESDKTE